jgi:hypothetical protein
VFEKDVKNLTDIKLGLVPSITEREVATEELETSFVPQRELDHSKSESIEVSIFHSLRCQENLIGIENYDEVAEAPHVCK